METLLNYIGLRLPITDPDAPAPAPAKSGLYINDLAGFEADLLGSLSNSETSDASGVWDKIQRRAITRLRSESLLLVNENLNFKTVIAEKTGFNPVYPLSFSGTEEDVFRGVVISTAQSNYNELKLRAISFICPEDKAGIPLRVFDLNTGAEIFTADEEKIFFDAVTGFNRIQIDRALPSSFGAPLFFIGIRSLDLSLAAVDSLVYNNYLSDLYPSGRLHTRGEITTAPAKVPVNENGGISGEPISYDLGDYGFAPEVELWNSIDRYIGRNPKPFAEALLYLCGAEVIKEKIASPRQNYFAAGGMAQAETLLAELENDFKAALRVAVQTIRLEPESFDMVNKNGYTYGVGTLLD